MQTPDQPGTSGGEPSEPGWQDTDSEDFVDAWDVDNEAPEVQPHYTDQLLPDEPQLTVAVPEFLHDVHGRHLTPRAAGLLWQLRQAGFPAAAPDQLQEALQGEGAPPSGQDIHAEDLAQLLHDFGGSADGQGDETGSSDGAGTSGSGSGNDSMSGDEASGEDEEPESNAAAAGDDRTCRAEDLHPVLPGMCTGPGFA